MSNDQLRNEKWTELAVAGGYRADEAAAGNFPMDWAVDGLLPATGATVWFGSGSTGKTQLLLWLAAQIAANKKNKPSKWLGATVRQEGHVLVLSAEDLREHLYRRIGTIVRWMDNETSEASINIKQVCSRIHVMPFLSMSQKEFGEPNPCLFERGLDGRWAPTKTLESVEHFIEAWNGRESLENRIVGVILDSAVSMAGFEMSNSEATSNFLFHINRMSRRQSVFWSIIGHTPKDASKKADEAAVERLRGSAMWSTTPRSVIEVRVANSTDNLGDVVAANPGVSDRDIVFVKVAKANSEGADLHPRALRRITGGAFVDITHDYPSVFQKLQVNASSVGNSDVKNSEPLDSIAAWNAVLGLVERLTQGGNPEIEFTRTDLQNAFEDQVHRDPDLAGVSSEVEGKYSRTTFALAWYLFKFKDAGALEEKKGKISALDLTLIDRRPTNDVASDELADVA